MKTKDKKHQDAVRVIMDKFHEQRKSDPIYMEGYNAPNHWVAPYPKCPYRYNMAIDLERMTIAMVEGPLTATQKKKLVELSARFAKTKWDRWQKGNYRRWCSEST